MRTLLLLFLATLSLHAENTWPPAKFTHVVAYCYDYIRDPRGSSIIFKDGTHHNGIIAPFTRPLSNDQSSSLLKILNTPYKEELGEVDCYDPHHAFVFYDASWKPVAWVNICFACEIYVPSSKLPFNPIDLYALEDFVKALGLPYYETEEEYQQLFLKHHNPNPKPPAPKKSNTPEIDPFAP